MSQYCSNCGSKNIKRNNDSKWLITIKSEESLNMILNETPRFLFLVSDYPNFLSSDFETIRVRCFEVWVRSNRCKNFKTMLNSYYNNLYLPHINKNPNKAPAPKNLFPDNYPFFMINPIKTLDLWVYSSLNNPNIKIYKYIEPHLDREQIESEVMPSNLLNKNEKEILHNQNINISQGVNEKSREYLSLRDTDKNIKIIGNKIHKSLT